MNKINILSVTSLLLCTFAFGQTNASYTVKGKKIIVCIDKNKPNATLAKLLVVADTDDIRSTNEYGETPMIVAARNNNFAAMKLLETSKLFNATDFTVVDNDGNTSMTYAVNNTNIDMMKFLAPRFHEDELNKLNANSESATMLAKKLGGATARTMDEIIDSAHRATLAHLTVMHGDNQTLVLSHH